MKKTNFKLLLIILFVFLFFQSCNSVSKEKEYQKIDIALGTLCSIKIYTEKNANEAELILNGLFSELDRLENIFSANMENSLLGRINANAGIIPAQIPNELYEVLSKSIFFAEKTGGAFNPAIGAIVKLWNIAMDKGTPPDAVELKQALLKIDYKNIELNGTEVFLKEKGMSLDLGGIAKGYAADWSKNFLLKHGIKRGIIDLGGNVLVLGKKHDGSDWKVGIKNPIIGEPKIGIAYISLFDKTIVTSGNYERFFEYENNIYHHILSPETGYPVKNNLRAVTVIADSSMEADALSTSFFILGIEKSRTLIKSFPQVSAVFFTEDNSIFIIGKEIEGLNILDNRFHLKKQL